MSQAKFSREMLTTMAVALADRARVCKAHTDDPWDADDWARDAASVRTCQRAVAAEMERMDTDASFAAFETDHDTSD